ncbi:EthD family reductase [Spongiimicrobium sp. 2-473A-2-J]|uniref:EthD family reductase n=1 Tax=Eudoraea algarum TaxID=3417568 RepID=UPI003D36C1B8
MKTKFILLTLGALILFTSWQLTTETDTPKTKKGMIKVTILYPNSEGKSFDMDYYSNKHMPMVASLLGDSLKLLKIDKGIGGRTPDEPIPYLAIGYLYFDKLSAYQNTFGPNAEQIVGDIPNYTNIQPIVQISEVYQ